MLFVLGGGLAVVWSAWGLVLIGVGVVVGFLLLRAKASTPDIDRQRRRLDQVRDDLTWLKETAEHPEESAHERLRALEIQHRYGPAQPCGLRGSTGRDPSRDKGRGLWCPRA